MFANSLCFDCIVFTLAEQLAYKSTFVCVLVIICSHFLMGWIHTCVFINTFCLGSRSSEFLFEWVFCCGYDITCGV